MVQRRAARYVLNSNEKSASITELLEQLECETLESRGRKARLTRLYKMYYVYVETYQHKCLKPAAHSSRNTHKFSYEVPASQANYHLFSFSLLQSGTGTAYLWMLSRRNSCIPSESTRHVFFFFWTAGHLLRIISRKECKYS